MRSTVEAIFITIVPRPSLGGSTIAIA
jgi:hypothetical protein